MNRAQRTANIYWTETANEDDARERLLLGQVLRLRDRSPLEVLGSRDVSMRSL